MTSRNIFNIHFKLEILLWCLTFNCDARNLTKNVTWILILNTLNFTSTLNFKVKIKYQPNKYVWKQLIKESMHNENES